MEMARLEVAILATDYIKNAPAIRVTNTLAPARAIPAAPAPPATVNILNAIVNHLILGHPELANARALINTLAPVPAIPADQAPLAAVNILPAPAPQVMNGTETTANSN